MSDSLQVREKQPNRARASMKRSKSERFVVVTNLKASGSEYKDNIDIDDEDDQENLKSNIKFIFAIIIIWILSGISAYGGYTYDTENDLVYNNFAYAIMFWFVCTLLLYLDYIHSFHAFQTKFETVFHSKSQLIFLCLFCTLAFVDYVLIGLEEDSVLETSLAMIIVIELLFYLSIIMFGCTFLSYWKSFSFHCSEKAWIHALLYLSVFGGIIIIFSRWIHPISIDNKRNGTAQQFKDVSNDNSFVGTPEPVLIDRNGNSSVSSSLLYTSKALTWNRYHPIEDVLIALTGLLTLFFMFFVVLGGIGLNLFAEFASWSSQFGSGVAITAFCIMSMVIMLTPLAPGSIVDACGGFVFIQILVGYEDWDFFAAWALALITVIILHFIGACVQWWMGTFRCIQIWLNKSLPVEMLAASDAVLREASWFEVGLVGYIFMDTANGLNQGRINMKFWTQLLSEWPALPNGMGLVSFGATIAASALTLNSYTWTADAVPLLILFSTAVQAVGFSFGTQRMASSVDSKAYWTSREKWAMMHAFYCLGYTPTKQGWNIDIFDLKLLYSKVHSVHLQFIEKRNSTKSTQMRLDFYKQYVRDINILREEHYNTFQDQRLEQAVDDELMYYEDIEKAGNGYFQHYDEEDGGHSSPISNVRLNLWILLVCILLLTFWICFYGFYLVSDLERTVSDGLSELNKNVQWWSWLTFGLFIAVYCFIYHVELIFGLKNISSKFVWMFCGCKVPPCIETRYETVQWDYEQYMHKQRVQSANNDTTDLE